MHTAMMNGTAPARRGLVAGALVMTILCLGVRVGMAEEDHLTGYKIKDLNQVAPPTNPYTMTNDAGSESCELKKPQFFLKQSAKNGGDDGRGGEPGNFVCYKAKCTGTLPLPTEQESQFGLHSLETKKTKLVCLPVVPPCSGELVGGFCWFLGADGDSCDATCALQSLSCDPATVTFAGTGGTLANCSTVVAAIIPPATFNPPNDGTCAGAFLATGCSAYPYLVPPPDHSTGRCIGAPTTCAAAAAFARRACACS